MLKRSIIKILILAFFFNTLGPIEQVKAQTVLNLPPAGQMMMLSKSFKPLELKGIKLYEDDPMRFDFLVDHGQSRATSDALKEEISRLTKYFLTALTVPEGDLWVNLSPYEKNRIAPEGFGVTEMGKTLLEQDYILKQIMASLSYPENDLGRRFWERVYRKAQEIFGTANIPLSSFNKVWIVPKKADVFVKGGSAFVVDSELEVMLETDYMAATKNAAKDNLSLSASELKGAAVYAQIVKDVILPELRKEVNEGAHFAGVRQVYTAMILASWYKRHLKDSVLARDYVGQNKVSGIDIDDKDLKEKIFRQYLAAYKKSVYNYIREEYDPASNSSIPRKYTSGGMDFAMFGLQGDRVYREIADPQGIVLGNRLSVATVSLSGRDASGVPIVFPKQSAPKGPSVFAPTRLERAIAVGVNPWGDQQLLPRGELATSLKPSNIIMSVPAFPSKEEQDRAQIVIEDDTRAFTARLKPPVRSWMDQIGWLGGMSLSLASFGPDPFALLATAVILPFVTRLAYTAQVWMHEILGHALPAALLHPPRAAEAFSADNMRANLSLEQWVKMLLPWEAPQENPFITFAAEGWRDDAVRQSGPVVSFILGAAATVAAFFIGLENNWLMPLLGPVAVSSLTMMRAVWQTDIRGKADPGKYECGNYGVFWIGSTDEGINPSWAKKGLDSLLRKLIVRGGQSAGEVTIVDQEISRKKEALPYIAKVVKSKRGGQSDLVGNLLSGFEGLTQNRTRGKDADTPVVLGINGHVRYATGGPVTKNASHPHMGPQERRRQWVIKDGRFVPQIKNVFVVVTHNGDNDEYFLLDRYMSLDEMRDYFARVTHMKKNVWIPAYKGIHVNQPGHYDYMAQGDSPVIAPQIHFHLTQGSWRASVRFSHVMSDQRSVEQAMQEVATIEEEDAVADVFEKTFQRHAEALVRPSFKKKNKSFRDLWVTREHTQNNNAFAFQYEAIEAFKQDVLAQIQSEVASKSASGKVLQRWHQTAEARQRFVDLAVEKFFTGDRKTATREFRQRAKGSYGLVVRTSLQNDGVTIYSRAQGMALGYNMKKRFFAFASDPLVLQVPFGDRGRLEEMLILDPRGDGEEMDVGFSDGNFYMTVFSSEKQRELTADEIVERQYALNERNPYYVAPVEYADPGRMIDEDLGNFSAAIADRMNAWSNPQSIDRQSAEDLVRLETSRYIETFLKEHSLIYPLIRPTMMSKLNDLYAQSLLPGSPEGLKEFLLSEIAKDAADSTIAGYAERQASRYLAREADRLAGLLLSGQIKDEDLYQISRRMEDDLKVFTDEMMGDLTNGLSLDFKNTKARWEALEASTGPFAAKRRTDWIISGYEKSLWLGENLKQILLTFMPHKMVEVNSANKELKDPFQFGVDDRTVGMVISLSGGTFPSLALASLLSKITRGNTFVMTSRMDGMINMAIGQRLNPQAPFTKRVFLTGNYYPAEAAPTTDLMLYAEQIMMVIYLVKRLKEIFPNHRPWGLNVDDKEIKRLEGLVQGLLADARRMTGVNEHHKQVKEEVNQELVRRGEYLAGHLQEAPKVNLMFRAFVFGVFILGAPIERMLGLFGVEKGSPLESLQGFAIASADAFLAMAMPFFMTTLLYRTWSKRPRWARMGAPTMVVGDSPANHQIVEAFVSKLGANAPGSMSMDVHGGNPEDHFGARFAHRIVRGTNLVVGMPTEPSNKDAVVVTLKQAKGIRNGIAGNALMGGAEITTISREAFANPDATDHHINIEGQRILPEDSPVVKRFNYLSFDAFGRLLAYKVLFNAMYAKASSISLIPSFTINLGLFKIKIEGRRFYIWDRAWTYPSISVHTTRSPIGISDKVAARVEQLSREDQEDQAMSAVYPDTREDLLKGGIDLDSRMMAMNVVSEGDFRYNQDQKALSLASVKGLAPVVDRVVPVTPSMLQQLLGAAY